MFEIDSYFENIIHELENYCLFRDKSTHIKWTIPDLDIEFNKCRKYCNIEPGHIWNTIELCESCKKILHEKIYLFNKTHHELVCDNYLLQNKIRRLDDKILELEKKINQIYKEFEKNINTDNKILTVDNFEKYKDNIDIKILTQTNNLMFYK